MSAATVSDPQAFLRGLFDAAVAAVHPAVCVPPQLPAPARGRTVVIGAGKAAAAMAAAVEQHWPADSLPRLSGMVVTRYGHGAPTTHIRVVEAAHPVPDAAGEIAAAEMFELVRGLTAEDMVLCLISGGGSALLALPAPGLTLADKQSVNRALLKSGANIHEMNCVRKHLSAIKGGRLALACAPARVVTLGISDIPGDDPSALASGPTVADPTTREQALAILAKYRIEVPAHVRARLESPECETPKPSDPRLANCETRVIATAQQALQAAVAYARQHGVTPLLLGDSIEGESRDIAYMHAAIARQIFHHGEPAQRPCVILSGGETTVTVRGQGRGGRAAEFLLALASVLDIPAWALACDTDGIDGTEDNAGAWFGPDLAARAAERRLASADFLARNDGYSFFAALDRLIVTGPTRTNVNDFRAIYLPAAG
ncbi:MAG: glycerate kinase [Gammaproteobacteria bacterium]|nr:glycerate kinase [Gammaproteobacteria bacterium]MBU1646238.1 glycerate kinase [Gammaproteobacteria bacterium]MBU1970754.1 glycerate kinase [Gammaproteobacteria bacterium]